MIDKLELLAIKSVALKDSEYFYRRVCRYYSEKFHTPLLDVYKLPWTFVFTNYLEHVIEVNNGQEEVYNLAVDICYPEKRNEEEQEIQDWIKKIEEREERKRKSKNKNPHIQKSLNEKDIEIKNDMFDHLEEEMENEQE